MRFAAVRRRGVEDFVAGKTAGGEEAVGAAGKRAEAHQVAGGGEAAQVGGLEEGVARRDQAGGGPGRRSGLSASEQLQTYRLRQQVSSKSY